MILVKLKIRDMDAYVKLVELIKNADMEIIT